MFRKYYLCILLTSLFGFQWVNAQTFFVNAGAVSVENQETGETSSQVPIRFGARFWLNDFFEYQGGVTFQKEIAAEGAFLFHPFKWASLDPYYFIGYGRVLDSNKEIQGFVPWGVGANYYFNESIGVHLELGIRGNYMSSAFQDRLQSGAALSLGFSYRLANKFGSQPLDPMATPDTLVTQIQDLTATEDTTVNGLQIQDGMVLLPDGIFVIGLNDEDPLSLQTAGFKRVTVSTFWLDRYEITNKDYRDYVNQLPPDERQNQMPDSLAWSRTGNRFGFSEYFRGDFYDNYPVVAIDWEQATAYCKFAGKRLPTEAEWEYGSRSGKIGGVYPWPGLEPQDENGQYLANFNPGRGGYAADGFAFTSPVNSFPSNYWGLFNISGNVAEWVQDSYSPTYSVLANFNPVFLDDREPRKIVRGGSWASDAFYIGVGVRDAQPQEQASPYIGARCARDF